MINLAFEIIILLFRIINNIAAIQTRVLKHVLLNIQKKILIVLGTSILDIERCKRLEERSLRDQYETIFVYNGIKSMQ